MPTVFRSGGVRFFFYSNEGDPREPVHVHVETSEGTAKISVEPDVGVLSSFRIGRAELTRIVAIVEDRRDDIVRAWNDHFG
jgi:hypothetical protein